MSESIAKAKQELIEAFGFFESWQDRYAYIIELSRQLPNMPDALKTTSNLVRGCQSQVWLVGECRDGLMHYQAASDAVLVSGLLMVLLSVYNKQPAEAILADDGAFVASLGLTQHLSPTRSNGLHAVLSLIKAMANDAHSSSAASE